MALKKIIKKILPAPLQKVFKKISGLEDAHDQIAAMQTAVANKDILYKQALSIIQIMHKRPVEIPPGHLQIRVSGDYYERFFLHGYTMLTDMEKVLNKHGYKLDSFDKILDFGCGCGRFLIPLSLIQNPGKLHGCDIDTEAINWLSNHYKNFADLYASPHHPPVKYADNTFDFIYSVSIFTHLPEDMQFDWLKELKRITKLNRWLILTTHGPKFYNNIPQNDMENFLKSGIYYQDAKQVIVPGLPAFYQGTYHTHEYIKKEWSKYFKVVEIIKEGMGRHQDLVLLQKVND